MAPMIPEEQQPGHDDCTKWFEASGERVMHGQGHTDLGFVDIGFEPLQENIVVVEAGEDLGGGKVYYGVTDTSICYAKIPPADVYEDLNP